MITTIDFITEAYFREIIPFNKNVDMNDITPQFNVAGDMHIQPILGQNYYNELLASYSAQTLNADETILVGHIQPALAYRVSVMTLPFLNISVKNKGPQTQSGDFSDSVDLTGMKFLKNELENRSEFYETRLVNYLCKNSALFPGYITDNSTDISPSSTSPYDSGFALYGNVSSDKDFFRKYGFYK